MIGPGQGLCVRDGRTLKTLPIKLQRFHPLALHHVSKTLQTTVLEDSKAGKAVPRGKAGEPGVCCLEEGGFGSDPRGICKPVMGLGLKDACFVGVSSSSSERWMILSTQSSTLMALES